MRRLAVLALVSLLGACSTSDSLELESTTTVGAPLMESALTTASTGQAPTKVRFGDSDPHPWSKRSPFSYAIHGTDVSKYQASVNWAKARASGVSFAFIKATEGGDHIDDLFQKHWKDTKAAGIPRGAYHFYYFCRTAAEQARWYIANVPKDRSSLPPVLDMEWNHASPSCKLKPSPAKVRAEMTVFLKMVEKHYGKKPIIYTSVDFFSDNNLSTFKGYPFWLRSVAGHPEERYGDHPFTFWQYTGTGIIPGINGKADINVFNGTHTGWKKWVAENTK